MQTQASATPTVPSNAPPLAPIPVPPPASSSSLYNALMPPPPPPRPQQRRVAIQLPCATAGCRGAVAASGTGKRCLSCVRGSWIGRRDRIEAERVAREELVKMKVREERERERERRVREAQAAAGTAVKPVVATPVTPDSKARVTIKLKTTPKAAAPVGAKEEEGSAVAVAVVGGVKEMVVDETPVVVIDDKEKAKATTELESGEAKNKDDGGDEVNVWDGTGWDSELSDLTSSGDETEVEEVPRVSLKIRIPARTPSNSPNKPPAPAPTAASAAAPVASTSTVAPPETEPRFCTIARCRAPLPSLAEYRWKCCSPCRKQYREYQRARHGRLHAAAAGALPVPAAPVPVPPPAPPSTEGPPGPNSTPPHPVSSVSTAAGQHYRYERTPVDPEAVRAHIKRKQWEREENLRALEMAGAPIHRKPQPIQDLSSSVPHYRAPAEKFSPDGSRREVTWGGPPPVPVRAPVRKQLLPKSVVGWRVCRGWGCNHVIPDVREYDWDMCGGCRGLERRKAERLLIKEGKLPAPAPGKTHNVMDDFPLAGKVEAGRCMYADCGMLMGDGADPSERACEQCVRRRAAAMRKPGRPPGSKNKARLKLSNSTTVVPQQAAVSPEKPLQVTRKRKRTSPYPAYQCKDALLRDFGTRFHGFIEAQSYYFLMRGGTGTQPPAQAMFDFSGEYSVVAADLNVVARKTEIEMESHGVKDAVARAGGIEFSPTSWVSILGKPGGVVTRFACVHLVDVILPVHMPPGHAPNPKRPKSMQGELEVAVLPDDSHRYFAGEKTIVRFRLVG
ncbi:hypothetical protein R3P38DRAFT_3506736 [Favolaschia claudopus]|uniref:C2H2-type domain-containing protein n=1 Tax=Favolaschia claudopus TaxID=2862362 RepID=A0AAW0BWZ6_9AGAR